MVPQVLEELSKRVGVPKTHIRLTRSRVESYIVDKTHATPNNVPLPQDSTIPLLKILDVSICFNFLTVFSLKLFFLGDKKI